jgi:hypothetical protein
MTEFTDDRLNTLLDRYKVGAVHETITELKSLQAKADTAADEAEKAILFAKARDMSRVLQMELREADNGEDFINDGEFHKK